MNVCGLLADGLNLNAIRYLGIRLDLLNSLEFERSMVVLSEVSDVSPMD